MKRLAHQGDITEIFRRVHFIGIGGVGMSGIAEVLCTLGRSTQARDEAAALVRLHPRSNVARHATTVCSTP